jgi:prepilin-type N-terminal cleavage/methylation domain-containing protein
MHRSVANMGRGFTLIELLIVVIILAILAAIVVPQFASTTGSAKNSSLDTTLGNMRNAIDLYYQQHGAYPGVTVSSGGAGCAGGTKGTGSSANSAQAFTDQLSMFTTATGAACSFADTTNGYTYGPYLKKAILPTNPITGVNTLVVVTTGDLGLTGSATAAGWRFDDVVGKFIADDHVNKDPSVAYYDTH